MVASAEESADQVALRAGRLGITEDTIRYGRHDVRRRAIWIHNRIEKRPLRVVVADAAVDDGLVADRLAIVPDEITAGHCVALGHPAELTDLLTSYVTTTDRAAP